MRTVRFALWLTLALAALPACGAEDPAPQPAGTPPVPADRPGDAPPRAAAPTPPASWPSAEERRLAPDHAPTPYTAAQIRAACPSGLRCTFRLQRGTRKMHQVFGFDNANESGVDFTLTVQDAEGKTVDRPRTNRVQWTDLQGHADYPAQGTEIEDVVMTVPAGTYACMKYTVQHEGAPAGAVSEFWFAYDLSGPPIKYVQKVGGAERSKMVLLERHVAK